MTAESTHTPDSEEFAHTETIVEYEDNRRTRTVLAAVIVLLFLLLLGVGWFVLRLASPVGAPASENLPDGVEWVRSLYAWGDTLDETMNGPVDTAIAPNGVVWVVTNKLYVVGYRPDGQVYRVIQLEQGDGAGMAVALEGIAVDDNGDIYVCDFGRNVVMVFSQDGEFLREWLVQLPVEVDVNNGQVAVAAAYGIGLFDTEGVLITQWGQRGKADGDFDLPHGILLADDGTIYVSDTQNRRIKAYDNSGRLLWIKAGPESSGLSSATTTESVDGVRQNMQIPSGMAMDSNGRLLVVDPFEFQVLVLDTEREGVIIERYGEFGEEDGKFAYPTGIAYDPARDVLSVADTANNRAQIIRIPGTGGNALSRGLAFATDRPFWLCLIPLVLLVVAMVVWSTRRKRERDAAKEDLRAGNQVV